MIKVPWASNKTMHKKRDSAENKQFRCQDNQGKNERVDSNLHRLHWKAII